VFIVFARIENDKNITGFIVENDPGQWHFDERGRTQTRHPRVIYTTGISLPIRKFRLKTCLQARGEGFKIAMNALNVGRIKLGRRLPRCATPRDVGRREVCQ
jgi:alkylation response protein AidB-like acyl-CoA dehydrogenase